MSKKNKKSKEINKNGLLFCFDEDRDEDGLVSIMTSSINYWKKKWMHE